MSAFDRLCAIVDVVSTKLMYVLPLGVVGVVVTASVLRQFTLAVHGTSTEAWLLQRPQLLALLGVGTFVAVALVSHVAFQGAKRIALRLCSAAYPRLRARLALLPEATLRKIAWWSSGWGTLTATALHVIAMFLMTEVLLVLRVFPATAEGNWNAALTVAPIAILAFWGLLVAAGIARAIRADAVGDRPSIGGAIR